MKNTKYYLIFGVGVGVGVGKILLIHIQNYLRRVIEESTSSPVIQDISKSIFATIIHPFFDPNILIFRD